MWRSYLLNYWGKYRPITQPRVILITSFPPLSETFGASEPYTGTSICMSVCWPTRFVSFPGGPGRCFFGTHGILMQSDLQSVGNNGAIRTFARAFASKMCGTAVSRLRMSWDFLQEDISINRRAVSRLSRCSFPIQSGIHCNRIWPRWIEKVPEVIFCNWAPAETGKSSSTNRYVFVLEKSTSHSEARNSSFAHFRGGSSCERADNTISYWLQIRLHKEWPEGRICDLDDVKCERCYVLSYQYRGKRSIDHRAQGNP